MTIEGVSTNRNIGRFDAQQPSWQTEDPSLRRARPSGGSTAEGGRRSELSPEQERQVEELQRRDREVRAHEAAHLAAGGPYVRGGAQFTYRTGPDGKRYAVGGEVSIDTSPVPNDPRATIIKMQTVKRAALAPADPSAQDRMVAATAAQQEMAARLEMALQAKRSTSGKLSLGDAEESELGRAKNRDAAPRYTSSGRPVCTLYAALPLIDTIA